MIKIIIFLDTLSLSRAGREGLLLALLMLGSIGLRAETLDPFPDVDPHSFYGSMMLSVKVVSGSQVLTQDVTVAVFAGDEIRGKGSLQDANNPGVAYLTVYGNDTEEALTFKVFAKGVLVEPDFVLTYTYNDIVGTPQEPYVLDISAYVPYTGISIKDIDGLKTAIFDGSSEETVSIPLPLAVDSILYNRTFLLEQPAAIILPFDITDAMSVSGCKFYRFDKVEHEETQWVVTMMQVKELEANMPYMVMPHEERLTFNFGGQPITMLTEVKAPNSKNGWTFLGTYKKLVWTSESSDYGFSASNPNDKIRREFTRFTDGDYILPLHCYLNYSGEYAPAPTRHIHAAPIILPDFIKVRFIDFPYDAVTTPQAEGQTKSFWFMLDGRKLDKQPTKNGLYINNGKKILL